MKKIWAFLKDEQGIESAEYAVLGAGIVLAVIAVVVVLGPIIADVYTRMSTGISGMPN
jgi:Flp pilus assembly pilin Flp